MTQRHISRTFFTLNTSYFESRVISTCLLQRELESNIHKHTHLRITHMMSEANDVSITKKMEKLLSKVNWKYVAIYSCLTLLTGLILLVLSVTNETNRLLFLSLGGSFVFIGSVCILFSCCFYDEFRGVEMIQTSTIISDAADARGKVHSISSSTGTSVTSGSPTSLCPPVMNSPWSPKPPNVQLNSMSLLTVPKEVLGFDHDRRLNSSPSLQSTCSGPPFSISIALPRVSV